MLGYSKKKKFERRRRPSHSGILDQYQLKSLDSVIEGTDFSILQMTRVKAAEDDDDQEDELRIHIKTKLRSQLSEHMKRAAQPGGPGHAAATATGGGQRGHYGHQESWFPGSVGAVTGEGVGAAAVGGGAFIGGGGSSTHRHTFKTIF